MTAAPVAGEWLTGRSALVTGGGSGIGRAVTLALAAGGACVTVAGRTRNRLEQTRELAGMLPGQVHTVVADISTQEGAQRAVDAGTEPFGLLDVAVNCAGTASWGLIDQTPFADWSAVIGTNLTGVWLCMKYEIAHMLKTQPGTVINVSSRIGWHMRVTHQAPYAAAKAGVSALTRSAALEYASCGIRVNAVSPGPTDTELSRWGDETAEQRDERIRAQVPLGRLALPEEVAAAVLWLASPAAEYVTGHDLVIDGGVSA